VVEDVIDPDGETLVLGDCVIDALAEANAVRLGLELKEFVAVADGEELVVTDPVDEAVAV